MTHPLMETHFEYWPEGFSDMVPAEADPRVLVPALHDRVATILRHLYHVPRLGDGVVISQGDVTIRGRVFDVVWTGELVIVRVRNDE